MENKVQAHIPMEDVQMIISATISLVSVLAGAYVSSRLSREAAREQRNTDVRMKELLNLIDAVEECIQALKHIRSGALAVASSKNQQEADEADRNSVQALEILQKQEDEICFIENRIRLLCSQDSTIKAFEELKGAIDDYHVQMAVEAVSTGKMSAERYNSAMKIIDKKKNRLIEVMRKELGLESSSSAEVQS